MQHFVQEIKTVSKHIADTAFLHRSSSKFCVTMRTFKYFGTCEERTTFVLVSRQVGMLAATSACASSWTFLFTFMYVGIDGAPIAQVLTVYQVLQGRRCYPHNINIKCNLFFFFDHIKRVKRKGHVREKKK